LYKRLQSRGVPQYAFPRLVAVMAEHAAVNATFKHDKFVVKAIAWEDRNDGKRKYWLDRNQYRPLDETSWAAIASGKAKL
jgi:hypothetical protein